MLVVFPGPLTRRMGIALAVYVAVDVALKLRRRER